MGLFILSQTLSQTDQSQADDFAVHRTLFVQCDIVVDKPTRQHVQFVKRNFTSASSAAS